MVNWRSPEEAEAWWEKLGSLEERVNELDQRLVNIARDAYKSFVLTVVLATKTKYFGERAKHYEKLLNESKSEAEMARYLQELVEEVTTYSKSL